MTLIPPCMYAEGGDIANQQSLPGLGNLAIHPGFLIPNLPDLKKEELLILTEEKQAIAQTEEIRKDGHAQKTAPGV